MPSHDCCLNIRRISDTRVSVCLWNDTFTKLNQKSAKITMLPPQKLQVQIPKRWQILYYNISFKSKYKECKYKKKEDTDKINFNFSWVFWTNIKTYPKSYTLHMIFRKATLEILTTPKKISHKVFLLKL